MTRERAENILDGLTQSRGASRDVAIRAILAACDEERRTLSQCSGCGRTAHHLTCSACSAKAIADVRREERKRCADVARRHGCDNKWGQV